MKIRRKKTFVWRRGESWHDVDLDCGVHLHFRKPRQTDLYAMMAAAPTWCRTVDVYRRLAAGKDVPDEERRVTIPAAEYLACSRFLADCTTKVEGVEDDEGRPVRWGRLDEDEQVDFYECLPLGDVQHAWGALVAKLGVDNDPGLLERLAEAERDLVEDAVGEYAADEEE